MKKSFILNNWYAKCTSLPREAGNSTIPMRSSSNLEVPALKIGSIKEFPKIRLGVSA